MITAITRVPERAVDEYLTENDVKILLCRIDYSGRIGVKL